MSSNQVCMMCCNCWKDFEAGKGFSDMEENLFCSKECSQEYHEELKKELMRSTE
jgi:hypothetical protein